MMVRINGNPIPYRLTSKYGEISAVHPRPHTGLDLAMAEGTKLNAPVDGVITKIVDYGDENIGKGIMIETHDHQTVVMGHLSDIKAHVGQIVHEGDFVGYSGNTGHSTGGHLHLGLKNASGHFVNPQPLVTDGDKPAPLGMVDGIKNTWEQATGFMDFIKKVKEEGLFHAVYGKSFFQVMHDFFAQLFHDAGMFILSNSEVFFVLPAIVFMGGTWMVGKHKYTKWIIPLWIAYFMAKFFYYVIK